MEAAPRLRLIDFIHNLRLRKRDEEADYYFYVVPQMIQGKEGIPPEQTMVKDISEVMRLFNKPPNPVGWNTAWGSHVLGNN